MAQLSMGSCSYMQRSVINSKLSVQNMASSQGKCILNVSKIKLLCTFQQVINSQVYRPWHHFPCELPTQENTAVTFWMWLQPIFFMDVRISTNVDIKLHYLFSFGCQDFNWPIQTPLTAVLQCCNLPLQGANHSHNFHHLKGCHKNDDSNGN